jgi:hypothetical protein
MRNIMLAIARLLGLQTQPLDNPVEPTPTAGPAPQVRTRKAGSKPSVAITKPRPRKSSPAPTQRKPKQEAAPSTTAARKPGKKKPTARQVAMVSQSKPTGSKSKTPASKTRQHAK